jgi:hypothetical protein
VSNLSDIAAVFRSVMSACQSSFQNPHSMHVSRADGYSREISPLCRFGVSKNGMISVPAPGESIEEVEMHAYMRWASTVAGAERRGSNPT